MPTLQAIGVNGLSNQKRGLRGPHYTTQGAEARCEVEHPSFGGYTFRIESVSNHLFKLLPEACMWRGNYFK